MKKLLVLFALLLAPFSAQAQSSKSTIISNINGNFADNTAGAITAALLRSVTTQIVSSYVDWITCTTSGGLIVYNNSTPACLANGSAGQYLRAGTITPVWSSIASGLTAGSNILITGTITPTISLTPTVSITSLALGGCTVGTDVLCATGTSKFNSTLTVGATANLTTAGDWTVNNTGSYGWLGRSFLGSGANGDISLRNAVGSDFGSLQWGGITSSYPAIARNGNTLQAALADGSGLTSFQASVLTAVTVAATTISANTISAVTVNATGVMATGQNGGTNGQITLNGSTSGSVAVRATAVAGTGTIFQFPNTNSISGSILATNGSGATSWITVAGTGTVTSIGCGNGLTCSSSPITVSGTITPTFTTSTQYVANTTTQTTLLEPSAVWASAVMTVLSPPAPGGTVTPDFGTGYNFSLAVTGNVVIGAPTNRKIGQSGCIYITMGSTTGTVTVPQTTPRTWMFAGGTQPTATVSTNSKDRLCYQVGPSAFIYATYENAFQ